MTVLVFLGSLAGANPAASETLPPQRQDKECALIISCEPGSQRAAASAIALAAGGHAVEALRGSPIEDDNRDRLKPSMPGMDCGIDRILNYVSCYSASLDNKKEAEAVFTRLIDDVRAALLSSWRSVEAVPDSRSIRSISYQDQKSSAKIDIDLVLQCTLDTHPLYFVRVFGWTGF